MRLRRAIPAALTIILLLSACREAKVAHYRVPKEKPPTLPPAMAAGSGMADASVPTAQGAGLTWTAPAHWTAKPASAMRRGSYDVKGADGAVADMSITAFPGDVGGELANINRWRGQLALPPIGDGDLPQVTTTVKDGPLTFVLVDFDSPQGASPERILGAFTSYDGNTWFFKLKGPAPLVEHEKPAFLTFLQTVKAP